MKIKKYTVKPSIQASKKVTRRVVRASQQIKADEDVEDVDDTTPEVVEDTTPDVTEDTNEDVDVAPEASDLLFETDDVAQLVADVTQQPVDVEVNDEDDSVDFTVGDDVYTVTADDADEIVECYHPKRSSKVSASKKVSSKRRVVRRK